MFLLEVLDGCHSLTKIKDIGTLRGIVSEHRDDNGEFRDFRTGEKYTLNEVLELLKENGEKGVLLGKRDVLTLVLFRMDD